VFPVQQRNLLEDKEARVQKVLPSVLFRVTGSHANIAQRLLRRGNPSPLREAKDDRSSEPCLGEPDSRKGKLPGASSAAGGEAPDPVGSIAQNTKEYRCAPL
jgi:hypothetical protein